MREFNKVKTTPPDGFHSWTSSKLYTDADSPYSAERERAKANAKARDYSVFFKLDKDCGCFVVHIIKPDLTTCEQMFLLTHDRREDIFNWVALDHSQRGWPELPDSLSE